MRTVTRLQLRVAIAAILAGIALGAFGYVRPGTIAIAIGTAFVALSHWAGVTGRRRIIECYFPLALAGTLFVLAISLPKGL